MLESEEHTGELPTDEVEDLLRRDTAAYAHSTYLSAYTLVSQRSNSSD